MGSAALWRVGFPNELFPTGSCLTVFFYQKNFCWPIWLLTVTSSAAGVASCPESRAGDWPPEPFRLRCLPFHLWEAESSLGASPLREAGSPPALGRPAGPGDASGLASRPRQPATSRQLPPACPAVGRFQCLKIALEETQVWGSRREMSLGRAASSTTRHAGVGGSGRGCPTEAAPAADGSLPKSPVSLCCAGCPEAGRGRVGSRPCWALG